MLKNIQTLALRTDHTSELASKYFSVLNAQFVDKCSLMKYMHSVVGELGHKTEWNWTAFCDVILGFGLEFVQPADFS